jgi:NitT/TauT family transport system ATP-binding protein
MSHLTFERVTKTFTSSSGVTEAVAPFDFAIEKGEIVVFLGPSGCGKTTLMRMVGGLETPTSGAIKLANALLTKPDRRRGMVFQSYSSYPWLTVAENVAFGMRYRTDISEKQKAERAKHYLSVVGLTEFAGSYPNRISGGMRQRVAIARTLAAGSEILLMDEPFGALDAQRREALQIELRHILAIESKTIVFVTHDVEEAVFLADRVVVFTRRPARILSVIDVESRLGSSRTLALRDSQEFFVLRNELLALVRSTADEEGV